MPPKIVTSGQSVKKKLDLLRSVWGSELGKKPEVNYCGYSGEQVFFTLDDGMSGAPESPTSITTSTSGSLDEKGFFYQQPAEKRAFLSLFLSTFVTCSLKLCM